MTLTGQRVLAALGYGMVEQAGRTVLTALVEGLVADVEAARYLLEPVALAGGTATQTRPGTPLSDLASTPYPAWLGQVLGVPYVAGASADTVRAQLMARRLSTRGTPAAIIAAVQATLTGAKQVSLVERENGDPWQLRVATFTAQTPNPAATQAAALSEKPVGIVLIFEVADGQDYAVTTADGMTYAQHTATGRSYQTRSMVT